MASNLVGLTIVHILVRAIGLIFVGMIVSATIIGAVATYNVMNHIL